MYRAINLNTAEDVIILDPRWAAQVESLRALDHTGGLVCPGCRQPVGVKMGEQRVWHFAHKHLANCPFESESAELLRARAALYAWLAGQFGPEQVQVEKLLEGRVRKPVDCALTDGQADFWIFDRRMPPDERETLAHSVQKAGLRMHWLFCAEMLSVEKNQPEQIYLTTTEREFMLESKFDKAWQLSPAVGGKTLHYLDSRQNRLVTFRSLLAFHPPQLYAGKRLEHPLEQVRFSLSDQDFMHPQETEELAWKDKERSYRAEKEQARLQRAEEKLLRLTGKAQNSQPAGPAAANPEGALLGFLQRQGTCRFCGKLTSEWVSFNGKTNECVCRDCADRAANAP